jgi:hypothetical protein
MWTPKTETLNNIYIVDGLEDEIFNLLHNEKAEYFVNIAAMK